MKQENWTKQLRDRLADYEEAAPADLWSDIEAKLAQQAAPKQRSRIVPFWGRWAAAAAVMAGLLLGADYLMQETENQQMTVGNGAGHMAEVQKTIQPESQGPSETSAPESVLPMKSQGFIAQLKQVASAVEEMVAPEPVQEETLLAQVEEQSVEEPIVEKESVEQKSTDKQTAPKKSLPTEDDLMRELDRKIAEATKQRRLNPNFGLYASNGLGNQMNSNGVVMNPTMAANYNMDNYRSSGTRADSKDVIYLADYEEQQKHYQPISFGLTTNIPISPKLSIGTGLVYTRLRSDFTKEMYGEKLVSEQTLHYLGIPVNLQYLIWNNGGLRVYAAAGGQADYNIKTQLKFNGVNQDLDRDNLQFSVQGALGVQFNFVPQVGIYVEPGIKYYFDNGSSMRNFFKDKPTNFNLQIGLRLNLGDQ